MNEKERKKYNSKGIFTVTQLSYTFRPRRRPKRLRDKREKCHHSLKALAIREKKIHIIGNPELKIDGMPIYLDVEGRLLKKFTCFPFISDISEQLANYSLNSKGIKMVQYLLIIYNK